MTTDEISSNVPMRNLPAGVFPLSLAFRHSFAIRYSTFIICFASAALSMLAETPPSAKDILASVRLMESRQELDLQGQLRQNDVVIPFQLVQNGPLIRYSFTNPDEVLQLRLGENSSRLERDVRRPVVQISLLADCARLGRGKGSHSQLLETSTAPILTRVAVFKCFDMGRQGERRADADGRLRLERAAHEALRSRVCAKDRGPLVSETNARGRISARHESRAGEDVSGN